MPEAIRDWARSSPEHEHHVLWPASNCRDDDVFESQTALPDLVCLQFRAVSRLASRIDARVVHAHSSKAGVLVRLARRSGATIYQPHCFAYEDLGRSLFARWCIRAVEKLLVPRTALLVALTAREESLARGLGHTRISRVRNISKFQGASVKSVSKSGIPKVVMSGRVCRQKDPEFFAQCARIARTRGLRVQFVWLGDGPAGERRVLEEAGVEVTGWLGEREIADFLSTAAIYLHSAGYEGFPLSVLDAVAFGLPVLARRIPAFDGVEVMTFGEPIEAIQVIERMGIDADFVDQLRARSKALNDVFTSDLQRADISRALEPIS